VLTATSAYRAAASAAGIAMVQGLIMGGVQLALQPMTMPHHRCAAICLSIICKAYTHLMSAFRVATTALFFSWVISSACWTAASSMHTSSRSAAGG